MHCNQEYTENDEDAEHKAKIGAGLRHLAAKTVALLSFSHSLMNTYLIRLGRS